MKRFIVVLSGLLVLPAFAEVSPVYYDDIVEYTDEMLDTEDAVVDEESSAVAPAKQNVSKRKTINRSTSRAITSAAGDSQRANTSSRAIASSPRNTATVTRGTVSRATKTNTVAKKTKQAEQTRSANVVSRGAQNQRAVTARVSTTGSVLPATRTTYGSGVTTLSDSGDALYKGRGTSSNRRAAVRVATTQSGTTVTEEDINTTASNLNAIAELTDYCKAQYAACMDNYCNVLDDNQGRCSCSKNIKNYEKIEQALATTTENFQDVIQKIKYIGLTADQINSLFAETEAELTMKSSSDKSQIKNSLDSIKKKIVDVTTPTSSSYTPAITVDVSGLLNADFTSGFDLSSFLGNSTGSSSVSNQRGEQLFKTATARCKTNVLNSCTAQGIDANVITNSYDLEIDKQCMAYERNLNEANSEMRANISNAANILQQARLMLSQNKNSYDVRGCVAAIDSCMQDEYVCGEDYELCLDPTGKYLANGEIVKGGAPGMSGGTPKKSFPMDDSTAAISDWTSGGMYGLYATWNYGEEEKYNAWSMGASENLNNYIDEKVQAWAKNYDSTSATSEDIATYLLQKIGYIDKDKDNKVHGMCASVMQQCQDYTFTTNKSTSKYKPDNEVVRQYLANALTKIKVKQDTILAEYAEDCRSDVTSCLSTNGYDETKPTITTSQAAVNACRSEITTCMSVGGYQTTDMGKLTLRQMSDWVSAMLISCPTNYYLDDDGTTDNHTTACHPCQYVEHYVLTTDGTDKVAPIQKQLVSDGGQTLACSCADGYYPLTKGGKTPKAGETPALCIQDTLIPVCGEDSCDEEDAVFSEATKG